MAEASVPAASLLASSPSLTTTCCERACTCSIKHSDLLAWGWTDFDECLRCSHMVMCHEPKFKESRERMRTSASSSSRTSFVVSGPPPPANKPIHRVAGRPAGIARDTSAEDVDLAIAISMTDVVMTDINNVKDEKKNKQLDEQAQLRMAFEASLGESALPKQSEGYLYCADCKSYFKPEAANTGNRPCCPTETCRANILIHNLFGTPVTKAPDHLHRDLDRDRPK
jgi:hypothetical protein